MRFCFASSRTFSCPSLSNESFNRRKCYSICFCTFLHSHLCTSLPENMSYSSRSQVSLIIGSYRLFSVPYGSSHPHGAASPPSSLLYLFEDWWDIEFCYQQKNYSQCQTILHSFLQTHTNDAFFITYDLILLNIKTSLFIPLCQSFLTSLPSCPNCPFHLWFGIRPSLTSDCITLQQFFAYKLLLLLLEHAPSEGVMIRRALSLCGDWERVREIKLIAEGSTDRTSVYGWM